MTRFDSIQILRLRRLVAVELKLRPLMVLVCANGCGKTSFLDAWCLFGKSAEGKLAKTISEMGGFQEIFTRSHVSGRNWSNFVVGVTCAQPPISYYLELEAARFGYQIIGEHTE